MHTPNTFFITGTDTGVGKTVVSAGLLQAANKRGFSTYGLKPLAAGCYETDAGLHNDDADLLMKYSSVKLSYAQVNPVVLKSAKAPHLAALEEGRTLNLSRLEGFCRGTLTTKADFKVIEGIGGWRTPLNNRETMSCLPKVLNTPTILVVGLRLGCLNHALLTAETIVRDHVNLVGWVANAIDPKMKSLGDNVKTLEHFLPVPLLGVVHWQESVNIDDVASCLDLNALLGE